MANNVSNRWRVPVLLAATFAVSTTALATTAMARPASGEPHPAQRWAMSAPTDTVELAVDEARSVSVFGGAAKVFITNPDVADVEGSNPTRLIVYGRKRGATTLLVTTRQGLELKYRIVVGRPYALLMEHLAQLYPGNDLTVYDAPMGLTITGTMANAGDAEQVRKMASQYFGKDETLNFNVKVTTGAQVNLRVRIVEVSRDASQALGVNLSGLIGSGTTQIGILTGRNGIAGMAEAAGADSVFSRSTTGLSSAFRSLANCSVRGRSSAATRNWSSS